MMKNLLACALLLSLSSFAIAGDDCIDCTTQNLFMGQLSMEGTNAADLNEVGEEIAKTAKVSEEIIEEICESFEDKDFPNVLVILKEEGYKLENVYSQLVCMKSLPTLMHFIVDKPAKYGVSINRMLGYFDQVKLDNSKFDYGEILNITYTLTNSEGEKFETTVLDRINKSLSKTDLGKESKKKLESIKSSLVSRGALTVKQINDEIEKEKELKKKK